MADQTDSALLHAWRRGEAAAGRSLYRRHATTVYRMLARRVPDDADDLLQQTFVALLGQAGVPDGDLRPYLMGIARNQVRMHFRQGRQRRARLDAASWSAVGTAGLDRAVARDELADLVRHCLDALPAHDRRVLSLHYLQGKSVAEIADATGLGHSAVKMRLARARRRLREAVEERTSASTLLASGGLAGWLRGMASHRRDASDFSARVG